MFPTFRRKVYAYRETLVVIALGRSCKFHRSVKANENALRITVLNPFAAYVLYISRINFSPILSYAANIIFINIIVAAQIILKNILIT